MIPADAPFLAFFAVVLIIGFVPALALVVGVVVIDIRVRGALLAHHKDERRRVDELVLKLTAGTGRRPMGFVLRDGATEKRHRGDGMGGEVVWEPEASDDAAAVVGERASG